MSESQPPNPSSREASEPADGRNANPDPGSATPPSYQPTGGESPAQNPGDWPSYPAADPYGRPAGYESTLYESNPYQPAFGAVTPYGAVPEVTPTEQHPQATLALILGILGTVLGMTCVVGGLVGIAGIVVGRRVRKEIDAQPTRYNGRSQAVGGIVTGIIGVAIFTLVTVLIVLLVVAGIASTDL